MKHYYECTFSVYRLSDMNRRPHKRVRYIVASNAAEAYSRAQRICATDKLCYTALDKVVCRHTDIHPLLAEEARKDIKNNPSLLIE